MITIQAYGQHIGKAVGMAELLKNRIGMLHQETSFTSRPFVVREDADESEKNRHPRQISGIVIKLSMNGCLDKNAVGYQKPKPFEIPTGKIATYQ